MFKGMIFDMDGVLIDSHPLHFAAWRKFLQRLGITVSDSDLQVILDGYKREEIIRRFVPVRNDEELAEYGRMKEALFRDEAETNLRLMPGVLPFLDRLAAEGIPVAIATSAGRSRTQYVLRKFDLDGRFREVICGSDVSNGKHDPDIFLQCASRLGIEPAEVLVFEDAIPGVESAKRAGMACIGIADAKRQHRLLLAGADRVISGFHELSWDHVQALAAQPRPSTQPLHSEGAAARTMMGDD